MGNSYASDFLFINPETTITADGKTFTVELPINSSSNVYIYKSNSEHFAAWEPVSDVDVQETKVVFQVSTVGGPLTVMGEPAAHKINILMQWASSCSI